MSANPLATADHLRGDRIFRDWLLFMLTVSSGAVDAISFLALGKVFTAFMTGNLAFLGMSVAGNPGAPSIIAVLVAIAGFGFGIYLGTLVVAPRQTSPHRDEEPSHVVWPLHTTHALAASLLPALGFVILWIATGARPSDDAILGLLALGATSMGMRSAAVRGLNVGGIFTTAATATFVYLAGDFAHAAITAEERFRLTGVLASIVIGATAGGLLLVHAPIYAPILPFVITVIVIALVVKAFGHGDGSHVPTSPSESER